MRVINEEGYDILYHEKMSGNDKARPELDRLLKDIKKDDTVLVPRFDRISRSFMHLIELAETFRKKGVNFISLYERVDTTTPMGRFWFRQLASMAELNRELILERTMEGKIASWERGVKKGRGFKHINRYVYCKGIEEECLKPYKLNGRMVTMSRRTFYSYKKLATDYRLMTKKEFCKEYGLNTAQYKKNFKKLKKIPPLNLEQRYVTFTRSQRLVANRDTAEERV
jgi:DNA invertase Pin-like site-specific DNA recombinase